MRLGCRLPLLTLAALIPLAALAGEPAAPDYEEMKDLVLHGVSTLNGLLADVPLKDGLWEGAPWAAGDATRPSVFLSPKILAAGDLDGDGTAEAVALVAYSAGGTGELVSVAVFARRGWRAAHVALAPLGDRVRVRSAGIAAGVLALDVLRSGSGDPMCCPRELAALTFRLEGARLVRVSEKVTGRLPAEAR